MLVASIYGWELGGDDLFNSSSPRNRDNCLEPMRVLQQVALANGIEFHTADVTKALGLTSAFNLYIESIPIDKSSSGKNGLLLFETPLTVPRNGDLNYLNQFDEIFTWDLALLGRLECALRNNFLDFPVLTEIRVPNPIPSDFWGRSNDLGFENRPQFCCLIASNRHANTFDKRELYSERVRAIRWFERNTTNQFFLYGNGWKVPKKRLGGIGRLIYRMEKITPFLTRTPVFPSYQGPIATKHEVLSRSRFCICYENAKDIPGYLTEKIFDCLFAGCIPIYFGDPNIEHWVPRDCFIDFRRFSSYESLYEFLTKMPDRVFIDMQNAGRNFILSNAFKVHNSQTFATTIVNRIYNQIA
jgi:hypothetical protein